MMIINVTAKSVRDVIFFMRKSLNVQGRMLLALVNQSEQGNEYRVLIKPHYGLQDKYIL